MLEREMNSKQLFKYNLLCLKFFLKEITKNTIKKNKNKYINRERKLVIILYSQITSFIYYQEILPIKEIKFFFSFKCA